MTWAGHQVPFDKLATSDLYVDATYLGGPEKDIRAEVLNVLLPGVGNQRGFRFVRSPDKRTARLAVLFTTGREPDWPDILDKQTGLFTYYGDNREPGRDLHDPRNRGNVFLKEVFAADRTSPEARLDVPPILLFESAPPGRAVRFLGLLAPGGTNLAPEDELVAIWRSTEGERFQNYRATFTVLDTSTIPRPWLRAVIAGEPTTTASDCPNVWKKWVEKRIYKTLRAKPTLTIRSEEQQMPTKSDSTGQAILRTIHEYFERPTDFEACAIEIWRMLAPQTGKCLPTRPSVDGGRDAVGDYLLGPMSDPITLDFALEAKCYAANGSVGVKEVSRLIARLRPRNFGVIVTTSFIGKQAYKEIREDEHPVVIISGRDIVEILRSKDYGSVAKVKSWLASEFPKAS
jgi:hypothetical protein